MDKIIVKEVVERPPRTPEDPGSSDDESEGTEDTSEGSNYDYSDDDEIDNFADRMEELMIQREAALAYHLQRSDQAKAQAVEHDPALADDEVRLSLFY